MAHEMGAGQIELVFVIHVCISFASVRMSITVLVNVDRIKIRMSALRVKNDPLLWEYAARLACRMERQRRKSIVEIA